MVWGHDVEWIRWTKAAAIMDLPTTYQQARRLSFPHMHTHSRHPNKNIPQKFYYDPEVDEADEMETFLLDIAGGKVRRQITGG